MKCPYCGGDMKLGYIKSSHAVHWGPERELGAAADLCLVKPTMKGMLEGLFVESQYCAVCNKIMISLN